MSAGTRLAKPEEIAVRNARIVALGKQKVAAVAIAKRLGVSADTVRVVLRRAGL